jgi:DNA-binding response OmpR family regulator
MSDIGKILLIEDDPGIIMTLRRVLTDEGYSVQVEKRGDSGLAAARNNLFDLVITDMKLPGLNGLDLVPELHSRPKRLVKPPSQARTIICSSHLKFRNSLNSSRKP